MRIAVPSQPGQIVHETLSRRKCITKKELVEWLKVEALSSIPSTAKKKKRKEKTPHTVEHPLLPKASHIH
jgi:hypothetical protein